MSPIHATVAAILSAAFLFTAAHESEARGRKMGGRTNSLITQTDGGGGKHPLIRDHRKSTHYHECKRALQSWRCQRLPRP